MATVTNSTFKSVGNKRVVVGTFTGPASYAAGGDAVTPSQFGLTALDDIDVEPGSNATPNAIVPRYNKATGKIMMFWQNEVAASALVEVTAATNLSGYTFNFRAEGI